MRTTGIDMTAPDPLAFSIGIVLQQGGRLGIVYHYNVCLRQYGRESFMILGIDSLVVSIQFVADILAIALDSVMHFFCALIIRGVAGDHFPAGLQSQLYF